MLKQKLISEAIELFHNEMKVLKEERDLLFEREEEAFKRFIDRCNEIHQLTFWERWKESCELEDRNLSQEIEQKVKDAD